MRVELINIGTELLMGFVVNTHAAYLGQKLSGMGATLIRQVCVNDTPADIRDALHEATSRADLVITTGGLGPTSDDLTRDIVVQILGMKMHFDQRAMERIRVRYQRRKMKMPKSVKSQAMVPDGATVLYNENGTAPGLAIPLPVTSQLPGGSVVIDRRYKPGSTVAAVYDRRVDPAKTASSRLSTARWLLMLPGPPRELRPMFEKQALPILIREFRSQLPVIDCRVFRIAGLGESNVEQMVKTALNGIQNLEIGYCARVGEVDLRLVVRGINATKVRKLANQAETRVRQTLGDAIFGTGSMTLEQVVVSMLRQKKRWVTTAESCTGGYLANRITLVSGSSEVFREGWVTYANDAKVKTLGISRSMIAEFGAVSEPVARAMAKAALQKANADHALAVTGIAGPTGGTKDKPVGAVFIALASRRKMRVERFCFRLDRETFKFIAAQTALNMLRKELLKY